VHILTDSEAEALEKCRAVTTLLGHHGALDRTAVADTDLAAPECRARVMQEFAIVQPRMVVVMGDDALEFLNGIEFPLARAVEAKVGELQRFTPTIEALVVPDIDSSLDEAAAKTAFWNAFKTVGPWWAALPPY
jgi:hypothetical protein